MGDEAPTPIVIPAHYAPESPVPGMRPTGPAEAHLVPDRAYRRLPESEAGGGSRVGGRSSGPE